MGQHADDEIARQQEEMFGFSVRAETPTLKQQKHFEAIKQLYKLPHITVSSNNGGVHIIITGEQHGQRVDFWPTTDLWRIPGNPQRNFGLHHLLVHLNTWKEL